MDPLAKKYLCLSPYSYCADNPINAVDPDGEAFNLIAGAIGAGVGALIGGGASIISQVSSGTDFSNLNWQDVRASAAGGAVSGGLAGLTMGVSLPATGTGAVLLQGAVVGGSFSVVGGAVTRELDSNPNTVPIDINAAATDFVAGSTGGALGAESGNLIKAGMKEAAKQTYKEVAKESGVKITNYGTKVGMQGVAVQQNATKIASTSIGVGTATGESVVNGVKTVIQKSKEDENK